MYVYIYYTDADALRRRRRPVSMTAGASAGTEADPYGLPGASKPATTWRFGGGTSLSNATCLIRPHLFYVFLVASRIAILCYIVCLIHIACLIRPIDFAAALFATSEESMY